MSRKKRIWYEGACYHIMGRGNRRGVIFREKDDYMLFMMLLKHVKKRYPFCLHAYCLMTNHFHLELTTGSDPIWKIMHLLMYHYARTFNQKHGHEGHLFDSRYTSCIIGNERYFLEVSRYIHLNPVKASMVAEPLAYEYSSYRDYVEGQDISGAADSDITDTYRVLSLFDEGPESNSREAYRRFVESRVPHEEEELLIEKDMNEEGLY